MTNIIDKRPAETDVSGTDTIEQFDREQAIKQIERRRRFRVTTAMSSFGLIILAGIWAISEYHNAGGWPVNGFSESSGIHDVWNFWIIYPVLAWALFTAGDAWKVYLHKPISEREISQEVDRMSGDRR